MIQADGGTRTASITGAYVALHQAFRGLIARGLLDKVPMADSVAAISCGLYQGAAVLDLDYDEDSAAETDANFVITGTGGLVEIQATAEQEPFTQAQFADLLGLAQAGSDTLVALQRDALGLNTA